MVLYKKREKFSGFSVKVGVAFSKLGLSPNQWTLVTLVPALVAVWLLVGEQFLWAAVLFIIAAFIDLIDGSVARVTGRVTKFGAYLDTIVDRYVEFLIVFGLLFASLPGFYLPAFVAGWVACAIGMVLVMAPIILFPRRGGVEKGKSFVRTTKLVDTSLYAVVRHPQYLGGILAIFVATPLLYPHWAFVAMGIPGIVLLYDGARLEDRYLVQQFGDDYVDYMRRVPRMNMALGLLRLLQQR